MSTYGVTSLLCAVQLNKSALVNSIYTVSTIFVKFTAAFVRLLVALSRLVPITLTSTFDGCRRWWWRILLYFFRRLFLAGECFCCEMSHRLPFCPSSLSLRWIIVSRVVVSY